VHNSHVVDVASESFEKETTGANPHSGHSITIPVMRQRIELL
jgi:hypothetical protein